jgi:acetyl-CoA carboxylase biotin carboxyl carrier protein
MAETEADRIRALGEILREFDLDAIRLKVGETEYELVRRDPVAAVPMVVPAANGVAAPAPAAVPGPAAPAVPAGGPPANIKRVTAPVVGVFYAASSPGSPPFASVGERVVPGQVLCILEAMKLMNEITSEYAGVVTRVLPKNGELVSLGDDLFWIEP